MAEELASLGAFDVASHGIEHTDLSALAFAKKGQPVGDVQLERNQIRYWRKSAVFHNTLMKLSGLFSPPVAVSVRGWAAE